MGNGVTVEAAEADSVLNIRLNRPHRLNAINAELVEDLLAALERARQPDIRAVVLSGRGRAFCAGHDLKEDLSEESVEAATERLRRLQEVTRLIRTLDVPVIAAVHGHVVGAGAEFALACDLVVAAEETRFRLPEVSLGLSVTNGATRLLPLVAGLMRAKEIVLLCESFGADEAHRLGLVNSVVPDDQVHAKATSWAERLAGQPARALALAKQALNEGHDTNVPTALDSEIRHALLTTGQVSRG